MKLVYRIIESSHTKRMMKCCLIQLKSKGVCPPDCGGVWLAPCGYEPNLRVRFYEIWIKDHMDKLTNEELLELYL